MFEFVKADDKITIKGNTIFLGIGIVACIMAGAGIRMLFEILPLEESYTGADVFGLVFICAWILIVSTMGLFAFVTNSKSLTVDGQGVLCRSWFGRKFIKWSDVQDWGVSYCGQTRGEGNTYYLYFSKQVCSVKNKCKKKLKGEMIKTIVMGSDYPEVVEKVIPLCKTKTDVPPFIGEDIYHFI